MAGSVSDIDARKRIDAALARAHQLEALVIRAGAVAHDFSNILGAILGYGEMALHAPGNESRMRRDLQSIVAAGERGRRMVESMLDFPSGCSSEYIAVHVEQVVRDAVRRLLSSLPANITLDVRLNAGRAAMLARAEQIDRLVMNLANNAIRAMPGGGSVRIALHTASLPTSLVATGPLAAGDYLVLQVADEGCEVAPAVLNRVFEPVWITEDIGADTALGLSPVHGIVLEVGGAIDFATSYGAGSSITVYLPRLGDVALVGKPAPATPRGNGERILIVDDEEPLVRLAAQALIELGYEVSGFTDSTAALAAFRTAPDRFDAMLTDERMPGMSGSALIGLMRALRPALPVLLMTAYLGDPASAARHDVEHAVLKKPLTISELGNAVARMLAHAR
jgi:CheY-like chemotaxis protein/nitrogen-specific signal transduction histidine kinase